LNLDVKIGLQYQKAGETTAFKSISQSTGVEKRAGKNNQR